MTNTYYDILGIDPTADAKTIRRAYLKKSLEHHPDKNPNDIEGAKQRFVEIGRAHDTLKDPEERAKYDRELARAQYKSSSSTSTRTSSQNTTYRDDSNLRYQRNNNHNETRGASSAAEFSSYEKAFDSFVAGMSDEELDYAMSTVAMVGGLLGSILASQLGNKSRGGGAAGGAASSLLANAGSIAGSIVGSQVATNLVQNMHHRSVDRVTYEQRRKEALERGMPEPERPKGLWEDLTDTFNRAVEFIDKGGAGSSKKGTTDASSSSKPQRTVDPTSNAKYKDSTTSRNTGTSGVREMTEEEKWGQRIDTAMKVAGAFSAFAQAANSTKKFRK